METAWGGFYGHHPFQSTFGGMNVVVSEHLPKEHVGDEIKPVWPHPFWFWLRRLLGREKPWPVFYRRGAKIEHDIAYQMGGKMFVTQAMFRELQRHVQLGTYR